MLMRTHIKIDAAISEEAGLSKFRTIAARESQARLSVLPSQSASHPRASMQETQTGSRASFLQKKNPILP